MGNIYFIIIFLLINFTSISAAASNSYANCLAIAEKFTLNKTVICYELNGTMCPNNNTSNNVCIFEHILNVTCFNSTPVRISIQSNGLPSFCPNLTGSYPFKEQQISFTVDFNPNVLVYKPIYNPTTQSELDSIVCNATSTQLAPDHANLTINGSSKIVDKIVGISIDGIPIFNAVNSNNTDRLSYSNATILAESVDECLGCTESHGLYHYIAGSSCPLDSSLNETESCSNTPICDVSVANYSISMFNNSKTLTVIGIAKDGHIIYGPYTSNGTLIVDGFDICNGMFFDSIGNYGYFVTRTFPYIIGCFGPGNYPNNLKPNCTINPPARYVKSSYAQNLTPSTAASLMNIFNFVFLPTTIITILTNKYY